MTLLIRFGNLSKALSATRACLIVKGSARVAFSDPAVGPLKVTSSGREHRSVHGADTQIDYDRISSSAILAILSRLCHGDERTVIPKWFAEDRLC